MSDACLHRITIEPTIAPDETRAPPTLKAVRRHCLDCCNGSANEVALCPARRCPLWAMRFGKRPDPAAYIDDQTKLYPLEAPITHGEFAAKGMPTLQAIRRRCIDCSGGSAIEAGACTFKTCDLYPFRFGRNPNRAGMGGSAEAMARIRPASRKSLAELSIQPRDDENRPEIPVDKGEPETRFEPGRPT